MSLSLSSLLNPSPDADSAPPAHPPPPPPARKDSLPPIHYVQSPEHLPSPNYLPRTYPPATEHDAVQALAALSSSTPRPSQSQPLWYGEPPPPPAYHRRSSSYEQRPGSSGHGDPIHLPQLPAIGIPPISPTLDQYHVPSRSPEHRRSSIISPEQAGFTLAPMKGFNGISSDHTRQTDYNSLAQPSHAPFTSSSSDAHDQRHLNSEPSSSQLPAYLPNTSADNSSPTAVKQEHTSSPHDSSPAQEMDTSNVKAVASLKNEHGLRVHSPLRESSVPVPSTETTAPDSSNPKKRPAPTKKKGTATTTKKAPPSKKRKVDAKRSVTPSSRATKPLIFQTGSSKGTPAQSSPPSTRAQSADPDDEAYEDDDADDDDVDSDADVYCICRKPDNGTFMIGCDGTCDDWFHGKCVGIEERDKNLIDKYVCPNCTKAGVGQTTWKRICRRSGCRQAARVGKTKGGKDGSKYCSDECGVLYFREKVANTRGREDAAKQRSSRRKSSITHADRASIDYDLGARGGTLAAGELKSLVNSSKTADDFKKLGEGVLSPPATPDTKSPSTSKEKDHNLDLTESEATSLAEISRKKDKARLRHTLLKDKMKFISMVKHAASATAAEKELKPKEYCGYDSRLEWSDDQFTAWRNSKAGKTAFDLETLATEKSTTTDNDVDMPDQTSTAVEDEEEDLEIDICDRKKCARHLEWAKLAMDDVRYGMTENGDVMRQVEKEEKEIRERAALRAKAGARDGEGRVEVHGLGIEGVGSAVEGRREGEGVVETVEPAGTAAGA